jgi:hypothetical protein
MRNFLAILIAGCVLSLSVARIVTAQQYDLKEEKKQLKARQKQENNALRLQEKYQKQAWKGQPVPKALREQTMHQMKRQKRDLRRKHKDELQDLSDRQKLIKSNEKQYGQQ